MKNEEIDRFTITILIFVPLLIVAFSVYVLYTMYSLGYGSYDWEVASIVFIGSCVLLFLSYIFSGWASTIKENNKEGDSNENP